MQCVILAGGMGTRMRPMTEQIPKSLLPVNGQPFLKYQLDSLKASGISDVVLCVGHKGKMVEEYAQDGQAWGLRIQYAREEDSLRGTAGALRFANDLGLLEDRFFVQYGDSYLPIDYSAVWAKFIKQAEPTLMTVLKNDEKWDNSNACFDGSKVVLYEKGLQQKPSEMRYVDYGLCAFRRRVIEERISSAAPSDLAALLHTLSVSKELGGFEVTKRFFEIGSPQGLADLEAYLKGTINV